MITITIFVLAWAVVALAVSWAALRIVKKGEARLRVNWFRRELVLVCGFASIGAVGPIIAFSMASHARHGYLVLLLSLLGGFSAASIEFVVAWRKKRLFIRDRSEIVQRRVRNQSIARKLIVPSVMFGGIVSHYPYSVQTCVFGLIAGYLFPVGLLLVVHFFRHHAEIERLTT